MLFSSGVLCFVILPFVRFSPAADFCICLSVRRVVYVLCLCLCLFVFVFLISLPSLLHVLNCRSIYPTNYDNNTNVNINEKSPKGFLGVVSSGTRTRNGLALRVR